MQTIWKKRGSTRGEGEENMQPQGWHPGVSLCQAVRFLGELAGS